MNQTVCRSICPDLTSHPMAIRAAFGYFCLITMPVNIVTNGVVLIGLMKIKSAGSRLFVIPLCINDLIIGAVSQPINVYFAFYASKVDACQIRYTVQFLSYSLLSFEFFLIATMGVERLIVLRYPMQDIQFRWQALRKYVLVFDALSCLIFSAVSVTIAHFTASFYIFSFWMTLVYFAISMTTTACYIAACRHVQKSVRKLYDGKDNNITTNNNKRRHDMALARSVKLILSVEIAMFSPYTIIVLIWTWQMAEDIINKTVETALVLSFILIYLNSITNVFLYSYHNRPLKKYLYERFSTIVTTLRTSVSSEAQVEDKKAAKIDVERKKAIKIQVQDNKISELQFEAMRVSKIQIEDEKAGSQVKDKNVEHGKPANVDIELKKAVKIQVQDHKFSELQLEDKEASEIQVVEGNVSVIQVESKQARTVVIESRKICAVQIADDNRVSKIENQYPAEVSTAEIEEEMAINDTKL